MSEFALPLALFQEHPLQIKNRAGDYVSTGDCHQRNTLIILSSSPRNKERYPSLHLQYILSCNAFFFAASVAEDSLLVLVANGLPHWLLQGTKVSGES